MFAQVSVLTQHNDASRSGANLGETKLTPSNVNSTNFGKLFSLSVDGQIYAQPLYVPNVSINGGTHNVVVVATEHDSVYAFDADNPGAALWHVSLGTSIPSSDICTTDTNPEIGITSTPVIDPSTNTIYAVAKSVDSSGTYHQRLNAISLLTGNLNNSTEITASVSGSGTGNSNGTITFDPLHQLNRPGLLLVNGTLYLGFGSHCDIEAYHGWIISYSASNLTQAGVKLITPNGDEGGVWQSGQGLAADGSGNIYFMTGNGTFDVNTGGPDLGDSFVKLDPTLKQSPSYFTPDNQLSMQSNDEDLGSGGILLLSNVPGMSATNLVLGGGKLGSFYIVNRDNMGGYNMNSNSQTVQTWQAAQGEIHGGPVYWSSSNGNSYLYLWAANDTLKQFQLSNGQFNTTPVAAGGTSAQLPGGVLSLSANGNNNGIIWATSPSSNANHAVVTGTLHAYDATNVAHELWNSQQNSSRDSLGNYAKFAAVTVANGKVYAGTFSNQLLVYGLLNNNSGGGGSATPSAPGNLTVTGTTNNSVSLSWQASTENGGTISGYYVYRFVKGSTTTLGPVSGTSFTDTNLSSGNYSYTVKAIDAAHNLSAASNSAGANLKKK